MKILPSHAPAIEQGIDRCFAQGAARILLYPYFLFAGAHVLKDLPELIAPARRRHPGPELILGEPLAVHPKPAEIVANESTRRCKRPAGSSEKAFRRS
jgi:sirohydrochlorin ferrochelatase